MHACALLNIKFGSDVVKRFLEKIPLFPKKILGWAVGERRPGENLVSTKVLQKIGIQTPEKSVLGKRECSTT